MMLLVILATLMSLSVLSTILERSNTAKVLENGSMIMLAILRSSIRVDFTIRSRSTRLSNRQCTV